MSDRPLPDSNRPTGLAPGVPYAYAAVTGDRPLLVFTAGACPLDNTGATVAPGDVAAQAEAAMANLEPRWSPPGARLEDVVKITVYVASGERSDLDMRGTWSHGCFGAYEPPATLLGVSVLGYADQLVEVEAVAALHS